MTHVARARPASLSQVFASFEADDAAGSDASDDASDDEVAAGDDNEADPGVTNQAPSHKHILL
jgi:hypothetical protein